MRTRAYSLMSVMTFAGVTVAGFIGACGGKVVVDGSNPTGEGGAGGGGAGGTFSIVATSGPGTTSGPITTSGPMSTGGPASSGATMDVSASVGTGPGSSVSVAVSSVAASSSTGVVNACDDACNKSTMCGLDFCGQFNINCANPVPMQAQCPLNCIANASCGDIAKLAMQNFMTPLGFCLLGCQGMGPGVAATGVGSTGSGPPPVSCQQCTLQQCGPQIFQCNAKKGPGSCSQWLQCAQGCGQDSMCLFGCDSQFPNAAGQYLPVYDCLCNSCDASCPGEDACAHAGPSPAGSGP